MLRRLLAFALATFVIALGGWPVARAADPVVATTLRLDMPLDPHTLMPLLTTEADEGFLAQLMFDPLFKFDGTNTCVPALAAIVPTKANGGISADGLIFTIRLRRNVLWHDGVPFTSADVLYTIHAILDDRNNVVNRDQFVNIAKVEAPDAFTVRFTLKKRQASFLATVGYAYPIVPEHLLAKSASLATDPFNAQPVGTGPYRLVRWQRGDRLDLEANSHYFLGTPKLAKIDIAIVPDTNTLGIKLRQHEIDFARVESSTFNQLKDAPGIVRTTEPENDFVYLALNQGRPLMRDVAIRRAIAKAIDKRRLVETITHGVGIVAYADLPLFMYDGHPPAGWDAPDPAGARALLDAAGWKIGADGVRAKNGVALRLQYIDYAGSASAASVDAQIIEMLRGVGIDTTYKTYATSMYFQPAAAGGPVNGGAFDIAASGYSAGADPENAGLYLCSARIPHGNNSANYCSPEMDRLQAASEAEYDPARRRALVAQIEELCVRDAVYVALYHTPFRFIVNPALKRPHAGLVDPWYGIETWTLGSGS